MQCREKFLNLLYEIKPDLQGKYSEPGLFFRDLSRMRTVTGLLAKLAYEVLGIYDGTPMLVITTAMINGR